MVIKNKQKGGKEYKIPNNLIDYFISLIELLEIYNHLINHLITFRIQDETQNNYNNKKKIINELKNKLTELEKKKSSYLLTDICKLLQISVNPPLEDIKNLENLIINSILLILNSLFSSRNINETDNFISKMLKIYRHKLFIDFWYTGLITNDKYKKIVEESLILLKRTSKINKNYVNSFIDNSNRFFNNHNLRYYSIKTLPLIQKIRKMFLEEYPFDIPIFYGNMIDNSRLDYNQFICKSEKVGALSKEKRNYIINPVGGLIHWLIMSIENDEIKRSSTTSEYNERLHKLLSKILMIDDINHLFPKITYLPFGTIFCIVKEQNGEEVIHGQSLSKCSRIHGCNLRMTAEIRKKNIVSNEDILEFLDIFLRIYFENGSIIILPNMNAHVNSNMNMNVRQPLTVNNQPNMNAHVNAHVNMNVRQPLTVNNQPKIQEIQIEHISRNVNKRTQKKYFEGIIELLYNLNNLNNTITQMQKLKNRNRITNSRIIQEQNNERNKIISSLINNILQLPESNIPELQKLQNDVKSSISQSNRKLLQSFTSEIINKILDLIILNREIKREFDHFLEKNYMKKMKINSIYQP